MNNIMVLDVTLRDGGCVNEFNFGQENIDRIIEAQEKVGIDIVEVGYLDDNNGALYGKTQYLNENVILENVIKHKNNNSKYVAMVDYGKFNVKKMKERTAEGIDGIRLAFHKKDYFNIIQIGKQILEKGYELYIQPMITLRYTDDELLELIELVNENLSASKALYIVDSFGEMRQNDVRRIVNIVEQNLLSEIAVGFHSHNNLQLSYANAISLLENRAKRDLIIDCSIMGMGKGAGNLNTELILNHLNLFFGKQYKIGPLLNVIDNVIKPIFSEFYWGYAPEYYLSAINQCSPTYASFFYNKHMLTIDQISELLKMINPHKKISFDREYAESLYKKYNERTAVDDRSAIEKLKNDLNEKTVLLIAPGKSIGEKIEEIEKKSSCENVITIGLNTFLPFNKYVLITRKELYESHNVSNGMKIICSNISGDTSKNDIVLDYRNWVEEKGIICDSATVIIFNILKKCNVKGVIMAGFDGYSLNINDNYYDSNMKHAFSIKEIEEVNMFYKQYFYEIRKGGIKIEFITPSIYDENCEEYGRLLNIN